MKHIILSAIAALSVLAAPLARAWSYSDGDLLLIFRGTSGNSTYDIEYDLGSVSNLLGHANGYSNTITGWNPSLLTSKFGSDLTGVDVVLLATTSPTNLNPTAWISSSEPNTTAYNVGSLSYLHNVIAGVGNKPISPFNVPAAAVTPTNAYSIQTSGTYGGASYDYVVSGGTFSSVATLGGYSPFTVQQTIPGSFDFWAVKPTSIYPNSPPDQLIGTFNITADGTLTFVAGPRHSTITSVNRSGNVSSVQFTTTVGNTYSIGYTNRLVEGNWPIDAGTLTGDGRINTLYHTNSNPDAEFYRVNTQ